MPVRRGAGHVEAVVLAGGLGSRLRPAVSDRPKPMAEVARRPFLDRKSTRLNSSHVRISYAVFCLKKKTTHLGYSSYRINFTMRPCPTPKTTIRSGSTTSRNIHTHAAGCSPQHGNGSKSRGFLTDN